MIQRGRMDAKKKKKKQKGNKRSEGAQSKRDSNIIISDEQV
jgi:hypothetical protein